MLNRNFGNNGELSAPQQGLASEEYVLVDVGNSSDTIGNIRLIL